MNLSRFIRLLVARRRRRVQLKMRQVLPDSVNPLAEEIMNRPPLEDMKVKDGFTSMMEEERMLGEETCIISPSIGRRPRSKQEEDKLRSALEKLIDL